MSNEPARRRSTHTGKSIRPRRWLVLAMRRKYGLIDIGTFRAAEEPNTVIVLMEATDLARAREYWHSQILAEGRRKAGVIGPIEAGTDQVWLTDGSVI